MGIELNNVVVIGIPVYKQDLNSNEEYSFVQCCKILASYPLILISYKQLNLDKYLKILNVHNIKYDIKYFDKDFFEDLNGYNRLMVNPSFYETFSSFSYLLIYQLDAFVFSDQLLHWCNKGYDYIGAPWLNVKWINRQQINRELPFITRYPWLFKLVMGKDGLVGNGGLSLRKIQSHIKYAKLYEAIFESLNFNEDVFWGKYIAAKERSFKIPLIKEALLFSIESDPENALQIIHHKLPFGCHAWYKKDAEFWKSIFNKAGIAIPCKQPIEDQYE